MWPGLHPAIIEEALWDKVQERLIDASVRRRGRVPAKTSGAQPSSPLPGKFRDETGDPLTPTHTRRHGRRFSYCNSHRLISGNRDGSGWRLPAASFEEAVARSIAEHLAEQAERHSVIEAATASDAAAAANAAAGLSKRIKQRGIVIIRSAIAGGKIRSKQLEIELHRATLAHILDLPAERLPDELLKIETPLALRRRGVETRIIAGEAQPAADATMVRALAAAHDYADRMKSGAPLRTIAQHAKTSERYASRIIALATLSPKIQGAIVAGTQPPELTLDQLVRSTLPFDWADQERLFGFSS